MHFIKTLFAFSFFLFFIHTGYAQDSASFRPRIAYFNVLYSGALIGKAGSGVNPTFSLLNGIRYGRLAVALGVGYDDYSRIETSSPVYYVRWKSLPLFFSVSYDLVKSKSFAIYLQANGGRSLMKVDTNLDYLEIKNVDGGTMTNAMLGCRISASNITIHLSGGYKWQKNDYSYGFKWAGGIDTSVNQNMERTVVQIGIGFR